MFVNLFLTRELYQLYIVFIFIFVISTILFYIQTQNAKRNTNVLKPSRYYTMRSQKSFQFSRPYKHPRSQKDTRNFSKK